MNPTSESVVQWAYESMVRLVRRVMKILGHTFHSLYPFLGPFAEASYSGQDCL